MAWAFKDNARGRVTSRGVEVDESGVGADAHVLRHCALRDCQLAHAHSILMIADLQRTEVAIAPGIGCACVKVGQQPSVGLAQLRPLKHARRA